jgi:CheY-like chemotaxis protein
MSMKKACILIAEDHPDTRLLLHYVLVGEGFEVTDAEDGAAALQSLSQKRPDLILTDLMMPQIDGIELIRRVRAQDEFANLPIVAMSAYGHENLAKASLNGATAIIRKPLDMEDLVDTIARLLPEQGKTWH